MTRLYKDLGSAFDSLRSQSDGGRGGGREKKEGGKKESGLGKEGRERLPVVIPLCSPLRTLASPNS